ncbi:ATP-binding cassette domain-containing protein [Nakamurella silvestris]|nr:ATP-binding cassette domain-containing protein [Nakamurella silvestris]
MLEFEGVSFRYRRNRPVLADLDVNFQTGVTVLLGPNGAGKSTLLSLAASAYRPRAGTVRWNGLQSGCRQDLGAYRSQVGWVPQQIEPVRSLTVREQIAFAGWLKGSTRAAAWAQAGPAMADVNLTTHGDRQVRELSGGQLRRLGIAQALVHGAQLLLLDEPTAGLDPAQRGSFRALVSRISAHSDVVISTHQTEDLVDIADHVVVMSGGEAAFTGSVADFLARAPHESRPHARAEAAYRSVLGDAE